MNQFMSNLVCEGFLMHGIQNIQNSEMQKFFVTSSLLYSIEPFHNGSKGESVKRGGGKTSELLCNELWRINTGNMEDSIT